jgi:hypothetical protein
VAVEVPMIVCCAGPFMLVHFPNIRLSAVIVEIILDIVLLCRVNVVFGHETLVGELSAVLL